MTIENFRQSLCVDISRIIARAPSCAPMSGCISIPLLCNRLFYLISENMRMNINYLSELWIEYDAFDFVGIKRNIRNSVEALFDLYNLSTDGDYYALLYYFNQKSINKNNSNDVER